MNTKCRLLLACAALLLMVGQAHAAYVDAPVGYTVQDTVFPIPYAWSVYGFDRLPSGNFVAFIGQDVVEVTKAGVVGAPLYSFKDSVYGSFVKVRDSTIYFGESSNGAIWSMGLDGSNPAMMGTLGNNYDLEFNSLGQAFVSANPGWAGQKLFFFDGAGDEVVTGLSGYSGPLAFDAQDNLLYETAYAAGGDSILRFDEAEVAGAIGSGSLTQADGQVLASVNPPADMEMDALGNVFFTSGGVLYRLLNGSTAATAFASSECTLTTLRCNPSDNSFSMLVGGATDGGNAVGVISTIVPVPEPCSLICFATGLISLAGTCVMRRRKCLPR
ncbi:MAG TPA: hypothetical protein VMX94_08990 [Armatimonadota bacterium]|nr:hypothetical protein [Armatimonadota bacterium]